MRLTVVLALTLVSGVASAQPWPMVESIEPSSGPPNGGTVVTIRGKNLGNFAPPMAVQPQCTPCPAQPPEVLFGGKNGEVQSYTDDTIVVKTPPNAGGAYDVQIGGSYRQPVILPRAFQYGTHRLEKILVPLVAHRAPGGYGSIWSTEMVVRNDNDHPVRVMQYINPPIMTPPLDWEWGEERSTFRPNLMGATALLYHEPIAPPSKPLAFNLRVRDLSRQADSWGTEVPLVRVDDAFVNRSMDLLNIPFEPESRLTLRIYDLDGVTGGAVPVYVRHNESNALLGSRVIRFPDAAFRPEAPYLDDPGVPGYIVLDVKSLIDNPAGAERVRVEVGTKGLQKRLWSFVSVTDLETQQFTIITPVR